MDLHCIQNCCRVCRSINRQNDFPKIFVNGPCLELTETGMLYESLFGLCIDRGTAEFYPRYVCNNCKLQLQLFQDLKSKAEQTLQELSELVANVKLCTEIEQQNANDYELQGLIQVLGSKADMAAESANDEVAGVNNLEEFVVTDISVNEQNEKQQCAKKPVQYEQKQSIEKCSQEIEPALEDNIEIVAVAEAEVEAEVDVENEAETSELWVVMNEELNDTELLEVDQANDEPEEQPWNDEEIELENDMIIDETPHINTEEVCRSVESEDNTETLAEDYSDNSTLYGNAMGVELSDSDTAVLVAETPKQKHLRQQKQNEPNNKYYCIECNLEFDYRKDLLEHKKEQHPKHLCLECGKYYQTQSSLRAHEKMHVTGPQHTCYVCFKEFYQKSHLDYHLLHHNNVRAFECEFCHKKYLSKSDLNIHQRTHKNERPYACTLCSKRFLMHSHLENHKYSHFGKQVVCTICKLRFTSPNTLRTHLNSIHKSPNHKCETCGKVFKRKHHLKLHSNLHVKWQVQVLRPADDG